MLYVRAYEDLMEMMLLAFYCFMSHRFQSSVAEVALSGGDELCAGKL
jgi:hypothetical protein